MKNIFLVFFSILVTSSFSQELVKNINLKLSKKTDVFQIVEESKKKVTLFFTDKQKVRAHRFNENFNLTDSISTNRPPDDYNDIIGYSTSNNNYYTYWSSRNNKEIASQGLNFETKQVSLNTFSLSDKEKPLNRITVNDVFYLITILKNTSTLNFYILNDGKMEKKTVDVSDKRFLNAANTKATLWDLVEKMTSFEPSLSIQNILNETPPSLTFSANKRKAYTKDNTLILTFDNNKRFTQVLSINLSDFSVIQKVYVQPYIDEMDVSFLETNSFILKDNIIQLKMTSDVMILSVKDLDGNEIKTFKTLASKEIEYKNSEIIQENRSINNTRILDNSSQLIRKIYNENPSVSCYKYNNKIYLTLGGVSVIQNSGAALYGALIGGAAGAIIGSAISSNYSVNNLNSYKDRKVIYINCLFDNDFNHIEGDIKKLAFDELRIFANKTENSENQTVFKLNSNLYYGGYDRKKNDYSFYKFND